MKIKTINRIIMNYIITQNKKTKELLFDPEVLEYWYRYLLFYLGETIKIYNSEDPISIWYDCYDGQVETPPTSIEKRYCKYCGQLVDHYIYDKKVLFNSDIFEIIKSDKEFIINTCKCQNKIEKMRENQIRHQNESDRQAKLFTLANFPDQFLGRDINSYPFSNDMETRKKQGHLTNAALDYISYYKTKNWFAFFGAPRTGKTTSMYCVGIEIIKKYFTKVKFISLKQLLNDLIYGMENYDYKLNQFRTYKYYINAIELLLIDEFELPEPINEKHKDLIFNLLKERHHGNKKVGITSNLMLDEKKDDFYTRINAMFKEKNSYFVKCLWEPVNKE
jgi:DNA replication protein DnaC